MRLQDSEDRSKHLAAGHFLPQAEALGLMTDIDRWVLRRVLARQVRGMVNAGPIIARTFIAGGDAEIWEVEILPDAPVTESPLKELQLGRALVAALVFEDYVRVPGADDRMKPGETAVLIVEGTQADETLKMFESP